MVWGLKHRGRSYNKYRWGINQALRDLFKGATYCPMVKAWQKPRCELTWLYAPVTKRGNVCWQTQREVVKILLDVEIIEELYDGHLNMKQNVVLKLK